MILVQYLPDRNVLCVTGVATPFPAGSLEARRQGDMLAVASPHENFLLTQWTVSSGWSRPSGQPFASTDEAFAYLDATCREKRPVGDTYAVGIDIAARGQTVVPLQAPPSRLSSVRLVVNGLEYRPPLIAASSVAVTWLNPDFPLDPADRVTVVYS
nr:hypothetical protein NG677_04025 [Methylobacterium sp. OTU13CASTA1]